MSWNSVGKLKHFQQSNDHFNIKKVEIDLPEIYF